MYDPLAVGVAIDARLVKAPPMHVDVETRGEFSRGETVANRRNQVERNVLHGTATSSKASTKWNRMPKFASKSTLTGSCKCLFPEFAASREGNRVASRWSLVASTDSRPAMHSERPATSD